MVQRQTKFMVGPFCIFFKCRKETTNVSWEEVEFIMDVMDFDITINAYNYQSSPIYDIVCTLQTVRNGPTATTALVNAESATKEKWAAQCFPASVSICSNYSSLKLARRTNCLQCNTNHTNRICCSVQWFRREYFFSVHTSNNYFVCLLRKIKLKKSFFFISTPILIEKVKNRKRPEGFAGSSSCMSPSHSSFRKSTYFYLQHLGSIIYSI